MRVLVDEIPSVTIEQTDDINSVPALAEALDKTYDLSDGIPVSAVVYTDGEKSVLALLYHHIMFDGGSDVIFSRELLARLRALTRTPGVVADNTLHVGNLTLDRGSFELYTPSGKYRLAGKEYQMIELLMATPGMLISTERFMDKIWGIDSEADISVVWTYISFLRKKLAALDADVQIKATRNAGYFLEVKQ